MNRWRLADSRGAGNWRAVLVVAVAALLIAQSPAMAQDVAPLVYLRDIDATILQDIKYASADNFTGQPVAGYSAPECMLLKSVAQALVRVQKDLKPKGFSLKVYDCYRPKRAVEAFVAWTQDGRDDPLTRRFHPRLPKSELISRRYISDHSAHAQGNTVDLTVVRLPEVAAGPFEPRRRYGACTEPKEQRAPDTSVDMGTGYDCLDELSHTNARGLSPASREARRLLVAGMARRGFRNYAREWWHFSFETEEGDGASYDAPIMPRRN